MIGGIKETIKAVRQSHRIVGVCKTISGILCVRSRLFNQRLRVFKSNTSVLLRSIQTTIKPRNKIIFPVRCARLPREVSTGRAFRCLAFIQQSDVLCSVVPCRNDGVTSPNPSSINVAFKVHHSTSTRLVACLEPEVEPHLFGSPSRRRERVHHSGVD